MNAQSQTPALTRSNHRKRYQQILSVFARHGFSSVIGKLQQNHPILQAIRLEKPDTQTELTPAEHFRFALEELGPTFIKMGQFLATRPDLLEPEYIQQLSRLQDDAPPVPWTEIRAVLIEELKDKPEHIFAKIDHTPLAAASLAQVHPAVLKNGDAVVVKIQRPNIQTTIETDLAILKDLAAFAQHTEWGELNQPEDIAEEFSLSLRNELDYGREGRNADRFRENFAGDERLHVPTIYWDYSTRLVLVMERLEGIKVDNIPALDAAGYDRKQIAQDATSCIVKEILQYGFYHADPHGGNLIVMQDGVIGVIDFGMMGELSNRDQKSLTRLYISVIAKDTDGMVDELMRMSITTSSVNRARLVRDLDRLLQKYFGLTLQAVRFQEIMDDVTTLMQRHRMTLPSNFWILGKTVAMMEGLGLKLDPEYDFFSTSKPIVQQLKWDLLRPNADWGNALLRQGADWSELVKLFPRTGRRLLEKIDQDQPFDVELFDADRLLSGLGRLSNRLSLSVIIAALVIGLAILIATTAKGSPIQILIWICFLGVVILGIWLIISIFRGR